MMDGFSGPTKGSADAHFCEECGKPLAQKPGKGRRKLRHAECKAFADAFRAMDRALTAYLDSGIVDYAHTRDIRSKLWATANSLNAIGDDRGRISYPSDEAPPSPQVDQACTLFATLGTMNPDTL